MLGHAALLKIGRRKPAQVRELTWKCHFCDEVRPDSMIKVAARSVSWGIIEGRQTRRYCADRQECRERALAWTVSDEPARG